MAEGSDQNRTEAPTQRRLQRAKESGKVAVSSEIGILASLAAGTATLFVTASFSLAHMTADFAMLLQHLETPPNRTIRLLLPRLAVDILPLVLISPLATVLASAAQTGFSVSFAPMRQMRKGSCGKYSARNRSTGCGFAANFPWDHISRISSAYPHGW